MAIVPNRGIIGSRAEPSYASPYDVQSARIVATGSTAKRSLADRFGLWANILDFGAVANNTTDNLSAINAAIAAVNTVGGGIVYIPRGKYAFSDVINITAGKSVLIVGDGVGISILRQTSPTANGIQFHGRSYLACGGGVQSLTVESGAGFESSGSFLPGSTGTGISAHLATDGWGIRAVNVNNFSYSLTMLNCWNTSSSDVKLKFYQNKGLYIDKDGATVATTASVTSSTIISVASTAGIAPGVIVTGTGISGSPTVSSVDSETQVTLSSAQTIASGTDLTFAPATGGGNRYNSFVINNNGFTLAQRAASQAINIRASGGDFLDTFDCTGCAYGVVLDPPAGSYVNYCWFNKVLGDTCDYDGWLIDGTNGSIFSLDLTACWGCYNTLSGIHMRGANVFGVTMTHPRARENGGHGFELEAGPTKWVLIAPEATRNSQTTLNTSDGIYLAAGVADGQIIGGYSGNTGSGAGASNQQRYGLNIAGAITRITVRGLDCTDNNTSPWNTWTDNILTDCIIDGLKPQTVIGANFSRRYTLSGAAVGLVGNATSYLGSMGDASGPDLTPWYLLAGSKVVRFYVATSATPGGTDTYTYILNKSGVDQTMTTIQGSGAFTGIATTNPVTVSADDYVAIKDVRSATAATSTKRYYLTIEP